MQEPHPDQNVVIDVSYHNGAIDWATVFKDQPHLGGVVVKLIDGALPSVDSRARANWAALQHCGKPVSFYAFGRPDTLDLNLSARDRLVADARREAEDFFKTLEDLRFFDYSLAFTPWLDLEWIKGKTGVHKPEWIRTWIDRFEELGCRPGIYTGPNFWGYQVGSDMWPTYRDGSPVLAWIADYSRRANTWENREIDLTPLAPKAAKKPLITLRQWSGGGDYDFSTHPISGIRGAVDRNWLMTPDAMQRMLLRKPEPAVTAEAPVPSSESAAHAASLRQTSWHLVNLALHTLNSARTIDPNVDLDPIRGFLDGKSDGKPSTA